MRTVDELLDIDYLPQLCWAEFAAMRLEIVLLRNEVRSLIVCDVVPMDDPTPVSPSLETLPITPSPILSAAMPNYLAIVDKAMNLSGASSTTRENFEKSLTLLLKNQPKPS